MSIEVQSDAQAVANRAAELTVTYAKEAIKARGLFTLALSGGSTPKLYHRALGKLKGALDWSKVHILFSDERAVGPEHEHSNYKMAKETLLSGSAILDANVHRIDADDGDHHRAAKAYEQKLLSLTGGEVDLVILGMGGDGHTASLFPGQKVEDGLVVPAKAPQESPIESRVTFSYEALRKARNVVALITSKKKASRLKEVLEEQGDLPMQRVRAARGKNMLFLVDQEAASLLQKGDSQMTDKAQFGVIGMGVMGANIAANVEEKGFSIAVYNRSRGKTDRFLEDNKGKKVTGTFSIEEFVGALETPRKILIMVKAGKPVDSTIDQLLPHLRKGDVIIDGGNEFYTNTERRSVALDAQGIEFVGMGVSGGEEGARHGPSMMPGGQKDAYEKIEPIVTKIAAQVEDGPCVTYIGPGGAGHYVKMVHNGIEYGDMQLIAETYDLLKHVGGLTNAELADVFADWNKGELESFLIEITSEIFRQKDTDTEQDLIDVILDTAKMKGTGSWTVKEGAELGAAIPTIASSVDARVLSAQRELRSKGAELLKGPVPTANREEKDAMIADAKAALYAAKACSYAQGLALLTRASEERNWDLDLGGIARIWKAGCIIRASFLSRIQKAYGREQKLANLLFDPDFTKELAERQDAWRRTIQRAVASGIAIPTMTASLSYYDSVRRKRLPANLTQAQRDFFGAHTYQRLDKEGTFHTQWGK